MTTRVPPQLRFTYAEAEAAYDRFRFNCGPAALCAVLGLTIDQFCRLPASNDFAAKSYTNPTLMHELLRQAWLRGWYEKGHERRAGTKTDLPWPNYGLARVQWGGPWTEPGVPMPARYRQTHWVGAYREHSNPGPMAGIHVFDVNALHHTRTVLGIPGWIRLEEWALYMVPSILETYPRASGEWWLTNTIEVVP